MVMHCSNTTEALENGELEEEEAEMKGENGNRKPEERNENEDPSQTLEELDASYQKENDVDSRESNKARWLIQTVTCSKRGRDIILFSYFLLDSKPIDACIKVTCMHLSFVFIKDWTGQAKILGRNPNELFSFQKLCFSINTATYVFQQLRPSVSPRQALWSLLVQL